MVPISPRGRAVRLTGRIVNRNHRRNHLHDFHSVYRITGRDSLRPVT
nr:MAG TPA: hypothetical protein [Caudoviricetes sp.]